MEDEEFPTNNVRPGTPFARGPADEDSSIDSDAISKDEGEVQPSNPNQEEEKGEEQKQQDNNDVAPEQEEVKEPVVAQVWKCEECPATFKQKYNLNKHVKQIHGDRERKYMQHIKKDKKVVCPVCAKEYTHSASLKDHIIKKHQIKEV